MSDAIEKTAAGATRSLFGALGFILLMLGLEGMTGAAGIQFGAGLVLTLLGAACFYAAFFWETAKKNLSAEAQQWIGQIAQHRVVQFGMIFLVLEALILSRFVEQHRWPFSYPTDPAIYEEKSKLENALNQTKGVAAQERELAYKWRFVEELRRNPVGSCKYQIQFTSQARSTIGFWYLLLQTGGWGGNAVGPLPKGTMQPGITVRIAENSGVSLQCAGSLQRALADIYPNPPSKIAINQQTDFLSSCGHECVQIEIDY